MKIYTVEENWGSGGSSFICDTPEIVYDILKDEYHNALDIKKWCKTANIGDEYHDDTLTIHVDKE